MLATMSPYVLGWLNLKQLLGRQCSVGTGIIMASTRGHDTPLQGASLEMLSFEAMLPRECALPCRRAARLLVLAGRGLELAGRGMTAGSSDGSATLLLPADGRKQFSRIILELECCETVVCKRMSATAMPYI